MPPTIEAQLLRTANAPLDIYWTGIHDVDPCVLDLALRHCTRWRSLRLQPALSLSFIAHPARFKSWL
jgi:hypothetical protein